MISPVTAQKIVHDIIRLDDVSLGTMVPDLQRNILSGSSNWVLVKRFFFEIKVMKKGNVSKLSVKALEAVTREQHLKTRGHVFFDIRRQR
jgi:hypothetical protein